MSLGDGRPVSPVSAMDDSIESSSHDQLLMASEIENDGLRSKLAQLVGENNLLRAGGSTSGTSNVIDNRDQIIADLRAQNEQLTAEMRILNEKISSMDTSLATIAGQLRIGDTSTPRFARKRRNGAKSTHVAGEREKVSASSTDSFVSIEDLSEDNVVFPALAAPRHDRANFGFDFSSNAPVNAGADVSGATAGCSSGVNSVSSVRTTHNRKPLPSATNGACPGWSTVSTKTQRKSPAINGGASHSATTSNNIKCTPIQLEKLDAVKHGALCSSLQSAVGTDGFFMQRFSDGKHPRIFCSTAEVKSTIISRLLASNVQFNSFNDANKHRKAFIIRGLCYQDHSEATDAITTALQSLGLNDNFDVSLFQTAYQRYHPTASRSPLFRVIVGADINDQLLLDIRTTGFFGVRVEKMKKSVAVQCRRCQRLHHITGQCHFNYRCVQCTVAHEHGKCPRAGNQAIPVGCINCFDAKLIYTGHTANDLRNCNFYRKVTESKANAATEVASGGATRRPNVSVKPIKNVISASRSAPSSSPSSYAGVARGSSTVGGLDDDRLARIVALAVQSVLGMTHHVV